MTAIFNGIFAALLARAFIVGMGDGSQTLPSSSYKDNDAFQVTGAGAANLIITLPAVKKMSVWEGDQANDFTVTIKCGDGAATLGPGQRILLVTDGSANGITASVLTDPDADPVPGWIEDAVDTYLAAQALQPKDEVAVATTANITLSGEQVIDGVMTSASRVLARAQSDTSKNGIYVSAAGDWSRAADADSWDELQHAYVPVIGGTVYHGYGFLAEPEIDGALDVTAIPFRVFIAN